MARSSYEAALARLLVHEGGYGNHPSDPGGPTNFGITLADYRRYAKPGATAADVRAMRIDEAKAIYREHYWNAMRCDELPAGLDYALFDFGVNSGNSRAVKMLQRLLGLPGDGRVTELTLAAVRKRNTADLIALLCDQRLAFLKGLRTWPVFGAGWGRRVAQVRAVAVTMARASSEPKAMAPKDTASKISARHIAVGGIVAAGAGAAQQVFRTGMLPASLAAIVSIALAIAGFLAWRWWRQPPDSPITGERP